MYGSFCSTGLDGTALEPMVRFRSSADPSRVVPVPVWVRVITTWVALAGTVPYHACGSNSVAPPRWAAVTGPITDEPRVAPLTSSNVAVTLTLSLWVR